MQPQAHARVVNGTKGAQAAALETATRDIHSRKDIYMDSVELASLEPPPYRIEGLRGSNTQNMIFELDTMCCSKRE